MQPPYDPFGDTHRARTEEFGDLLAEGLYALFQDQPAEMDYRDRITCADARYWRRFIRARRANLRMVRRELKCGTHGPTDDADRRIDALRALDAAESQLSTLGPDLCVDFLRAWTTDLADWEQSTQRICPIGGPDRALRELRLDRWAAVGPVLDHNPRAGPVA
jgi:hypothetical protein